MVVIPSIAPGYVIVAVFAQSTLLFFGGVPEHPDRLPE
jgi:hypothetical protein